MFNTYNRKIPQIITSRSGWPWSYANTSCNYKFTDVMSSLPKISIITPSYNQGHFLEETIRSILIQDYQNLEYIVIDGGSTDNSVEILSRYDDFIDYWISAPDNGQADAINKGFQRSTGEILGYVNSDDILLPGALCNVARFFASHIEFDLVIGKSVLIDSISDPYYYVLGLPPTYLRLLFWGTGGFTQPSSFWRKEAYLSAGSLDATLNFAIDYDLYFRLTKHRPAGRINQYLAAFRVHSDSKSNNIQPVRQNEDAALRLRYGIYNYPIYFQRLAWVYYHLTYLMHAAWFKIRSWIGLEKYPNLK